MKTKHYQIKPYWAKNKGIPATFVAVAVRTTERAIMLTGRGTLDARGVCMNCGRELTHPVSVLVGIGPECGKHFWDESVLGPYGFTEAHAEQLKSMMVQQQFENVWLPKTAFKEISDTDETVQIEIEKPEPKKEIIKEAKQLTPQTLEILFPFDWMTVHFVKKEIAGRKFNSNTKNWNAPITLENIKKLEADGFKIEPCLLKIVEDTVKEKATAVPTKELNFGHLNDILFPYQKAGVEFIERCNGNALVGDEMGLGKTIQALAWLERHPEIRPAVVVVPASLKLNWEREVNKWMKTKKKVYVCHGRTVKNMTTFHGFSDADIIIINYDILSDWWLNQFEKRKVQAMVLDEVHYIKNNTAKRTKAVKKLKRMVKHTVALSGTPITNRPMELFTAVNMLAPQLFSSRFKFGQDYCGGHNNGFGWDFSGATNTEKLHEILTTSIMVRRLKADVLKELPPKIRSVVPIELTNRSEYITAEKDFISYLRAFDEAKATKAERAQALVEIEGLKQLSIKGKMKGAIDWIDDHLATNGKLVIFCTHKETINLLMTQYSKIAVKLDGSTAQADRQKAVDSFQNDPNIRLFVGNIKAAGVGITLTAASSVVFMELGWTPGEHDQAEDRIHRIGQEADSINAYYLIAEHTIEEEISKLLDDKRKVLTSVLDGKDVEDSSMLQALLTNYREREGI